MRHSNKSTKDTKHPLRRAWNKYRSRGGLLGFHEWLATRTKLDSIGRRMALPRGCRVPATQSLFLSGLPKRSSDVFSNWRRRRKKRGLPHDTKAFLAYLNTRTDRDDHAALISYLTELVQSE